MGQRRLLAIGAIVGGVIVARRLLRSTGPGRIMERLMAQMPPDSPPKLVTSILPRLREQNDEIVAVLREQNELLRRRWPEVTRGSEIPIDPTFAPLRGNPRFERLVAGGRDSGT